MVLTQLELFRWNSAHVFTKAVLLQENTPVNFSKPKNGIKYDFYLLLFWLLNHPLDFQFLLYPEVISFEEPNSVHGSMCAHGSDNINYEIQMARWRSFATFLFSLHGQSHT